MSKSKRNKNKKKQAARKPVGGVPTQAEKVTVAWTLCVLTALGTQVIALLVAAVRYVAEMPPQIELLQGLLMLSAALAGLISIFLLPIVTRFSKRRPPNSVMVVGLVAATTPMLYLLWLLSQ